jgi:hypothetical protein
MMASAVMLAAISSGVGGSTGVAALPEPENTASSAA